MYKHLSKFKALVGLGILVRLALCFWTGHPWDFETFIRVGYYVANGSSLFQAENYYIEGLGQPVFPYVSGLGYLPAWGLYTAFAYKIYSFSPFSPLFYYFMLKLAPIVGDLASAYIIYLLTLIFTDDDVRKARLNSLMFFLCPFTIFISAVWGMFDSVPLAFTLASVLLLLLERFCWSGFCLGMGIYFKVVPIIYLPINLFYIGKRRGIKEATTHLLVAVGVPLILTIIPIILFNWELSKAAITVFSQTQKTGEVLTYWNLNILLNHLFPNVFSTETVSEVFSFPLVRYLWILGLMLSYFYYYKLQIPSFNEEGSRRCDLNMLLTGYLLTTISFLLTRTFIPEQFVLYLAPMIIIQLELSRFPKWKHIWISALIFAFVNLYPFAFAYLVDSNLWYTFSYLATTQPYSTARYAARSISALLFDYLLLKTLFGTVKRYGKNF